MTTTSARKLHPRFATYGRDNGTNGAGDTVHDRCVDWNGWSGSIASQKDTAQLIRHDDPARGRHPSFRP
jgi:hypothetical protein